MADPIGINTAGSTPGSLHESAPTGGSSTKAPKDKTCPFCHTPYTASSLGRHLDTYIRLKNPKPADGIHDVEKIKKIREGITRRQMRHGSKRDASMSLSRQVSGENSRNAESDDEDMDDEDSPMSPLSTGPTQKPNQESGEKMRWRSNQPDWSATGAVSGIPSRSVSTVSEARRDVSRHHLLKADFESRQKMSEDAETGHAAEWALKEVLERIREAQSRPAQSAIFQFDPYELTFPALCLKILPAPPTLFSPSPFPTHETWPIGLPGAKQWEALQKALKERVASYQRALEATGSSQANAEAELGRLQNHLHVSYHHWQCLSDRQRQEAWQLEILRAFSAAEDRCKILQNQMDVTVKQHDKLRKELEDLRRARDHGEADPVQTLSSVSTTSMERILKHGFDINQWDYDSLLEKWKSVLKDRKKATTGMAAQRKLSATPTVKLNNKKINSRNNFSKIQEEDADSTAQLEGLSPNNTRIQFAEPFGAPGKPLNHSQQQTQVQQPEPELIEVDEPTPILQPQPQQPLQHHDFSISQQHSPRPPSPQFNPHLSAQASVNDQRRHSLQLSPHSIAPQQRRVSVQHDHLTPQPQAHPPMMTPTRHEDAAGNPQMIQFTQPPMLQIPQGTAAQPVQVASPFSTTPIAPPPPHLQGWMHPQQPPQADPQQMQQQLSQETHRIQQHAQQMSQELQAQHVHSMAPGPMPQQAHFPQHQMTEADFQNMGLQVPNRPDRRNSHPLIDTGHHGMQMQQSVEAPASAGGYMGVRMQSGLEGMAMGFVGPEMGLTNGTGAPVG